MQLKPSLSSHDDPFAIALAETLGMKVSPEPLKRADELRREHPRAPTAGEQPGTVLDLLNGCVNAMAILETRMGDWDGQAKMSADAYARERTEQRAEIAALKGRLKLDADRIDQAEKRLADFEDALTRTAQELGAARADIAAWKVRADAAEKRADHWHERLVTVEVGLQTQVDVTTRALTTAQSDAAHYRDRAESSEAAVAELATRLDEATLTSQDQRARIACLQAKLAAARDVSRFESLSAAPAPRGPVARDIIDVTDIGHAVLVSAA